MNEGTLLIRADANVAIGTGHVMRCLALAQHWQDAGGAVVFAMAESLPLVRERLVSEGIESFPVEGQAGSRADATSLAEMAMRFNANWVVVDGYHFDADYQRQLKAAGVHVLFVDDDGRCSHYAADLVVNQNVHADESLYPSREPYTRLLLGLRYVLLRREFARWREWKREIPEMGRKFLITMGGSDPDGMTSLAIEALVQARISDMEAVIVVGGSNPQVQSVQRLAARCGSSVRLLEDSSNMPELMAWADLAVIAGGGTLWELLYMGCPVLSYARNAVQEQIASELDSEGIIRELGYPQNCNGEQAAAALAQLASSREQRARYSRLGRERIDGRGAERVLEILVSAEVRQPVIAVMQAVSPKDREAFLAMAERLFRGLNPNFVPHADWSRSYFENILGNADLSLRWIVVDGARAGFILFGLEPHRFLPRFNHMIYELYIQPEFRRKGVAHTVARQAIRELQSKSPAKIQLEVMDGNHAAVTLWESLGFRKVSERYVLQAEAKE